MDRITAGPAQLPPRQAASPCAPGACSFLQPKAEVPPSINAASCIAHAIPASLCSDPGLSCRRRQKSPPSPMPSSAWRMPMPTVGVDAQQGRLCCRVLAAACRLQHVPRSRHCAARVRHPALALAQQTDAQPGRRETEQSLRVASPPPLPCRVPAHQRCLRGGRGAAQDPQAPGKPEWQH